MPSTKYAVPASPRLLRTSEEEAREEETASRFDLRYVLSSTVWEGASRRDRPEMMMRGVEEGRDLESALERERERWRGEEVWTVE